MHVGRRMVLKLLASFALIPSGIIWRKRAAAQTQPSLALRTVLPEDASALQAIMTSCVAAQDSFYGKCGEWPMSWAQEFVTRCPQTPVVTQDGTPIAFLEVPPIRPPLPPPPPDATPEELEKYALRERNRTTYRVTAAGIRYDAVSPSDVIEMFITILYYAAQAARAIGYQYLEAWAPWDQHPKMTRKWTDYPGCELVGVGRNQEGGNDVYILRWRLDDAIPALAAEEHYDVA